MAKQAAPDTNRNVEGHEAAHSIVAFIRGFPFSHISVGRIGGTDHVGQFVGDDEGVRQIILKAMRERSDLSPLLISMAMVGIVAKKVDVKYQDFSEEDASKRAGKDLKVFDDYCEYFKVSDCTKEQILNHAHHKVDTLLDSPSFRTAWQRVSKAVEVNRVLDSTAVRDAIGDAFNE